MNITELLWWVYSHLCLGSEVRRLKAVCVTGKMGELWGIYKHRLFFLPVAGSLIKKRALPPTSASLVNDSNSNNTVTNIKVRNYEVLTNFDQPVFQGIFWGLCVFQVFLSLVSFAAATTWVPCWSGYRCPGVGGWKIRAVCLAVRVLIYVICSVSCGVQCPFAKDGFTPLKHELTFHFSHFSPFFHTFQLL